MSAKQSQEYNGNGNHKWEPVVTTYTTGTFRLRVPGGWLYRSAVDIGRDTVLATETFVPMPAVVKHAV